MKHTVQSVTAQHYLYYDSPKWGALPSETPVALTDVQLLKVLKELARDSRHGENQIFIRQAKAKADDGRPRIT